MTHLLGTLSLTLALAFAITSGPSALGEERMAYMHETEAGKQIVLSDANGGHAREITSGKLWHLYPDLTSTGQTVAYVEGTGETNLNVLTLNLSTKVVEQWTTGSGMRIHPHFSTDGRFLAFSGPYGPEGRAQIAVLDLTEARSKSSRVWDSLAEPPRWVYSVKPEIIPSDFPAYFPTFSADGRTIFFQRSKGKDGKDIVAWDLDEKKVTQVTPAQGITMKPALSFDNRWLAFTAFVDKKWDIYLSDRIGGQRYRVTQAPGHNFAPTFRPDGSLVFASDREGHFQLYEVTADEMASLTFKDRLLVGGPGEFYAPSVSGEVKVEQAMLPLISEPARSSFGALRLGNKIFVAGGHQGHEHTYPKSSFLDKVEYYDLDTKRWVEVAPRPHACHGYGIAGQGKYLYAFGGFAYSDAYDPKWVSLDAIDRYDTQKNQWVTLPVKLASPRSSNVVAQIGGKVYLIAGWDSTPRHKGDADGRFLRSIEVFDLRTEKPSLSPYTLPDPLRRALSGIVLGGEILLVGGIGVGASHFSLLDDVTAFNPETGAWRELPRLPYATFAPATGALGNQIFVFGGMFKFGPQTFDYVNHIFTLKAGAPRWTHSGRYLSQKKGFSMVVPLAESTLGILGGHTYADDTDGPVRTFESFGFAK